jgi:hypothetical protein
LRRIFLGLKDKPVNTLRVVPYRDVKHKIVENVDIEISADLITVSHGSNWLQQGSCACQGISQLNLDPTDWRVFIDTITDLRNPHFCCHVVRFDIVHVIERLHLS